MIASPLRASRPQRCQWRAFHLASALCALSPALAAAQWEGVEVVPLADSPSSERSTRYSIAVDADDVPHALWGSSGLGFYSHGAAGAWIAPIEIGNDDAVYSPHAIAIVPGTTTPVILYSRRPIGEPAGELMLGVWSGGGFDEIPLTSDALAEHDPALTLDASGAYHVVCVSEVEGTWRLRYLTNATGAPTDELVSAGPLGDFGSGASPSIAVEPGGIAHIAYRGVTGGYRIHHAENAAPGSSSFVWETLVTPNGEDLSADIASDATGDLHVAVSGGDCFGCNPHAYVFRRVAGTWETPVPIVHTMGLSGPALAVDGGGHAHVALAEVGGNFYTGRLFYASSLGGWSPAPIIGDDHATPSLAVDATGRGHLVCTTGPNTGVEDVLYLESDVLTVGVGAPGATPSMTRWIAAPNPFSVGTRVRGAAGGRSGSRSGSRSGDDTRGFGVYDVAGRLVRALPVPSGARNDAAIVWDGRDRDGVAVPAGVYLIGEPDGGTVRVVKLP